MKSFLVRLVRLFPGGFREQFGAAMREQIEIDYKLARTRGPGAALWFVVATTADLFASVLLERWNPSLSAVPATPTPRKSLMWSMSEWSRDIRHAARALRRTPGFAAVAIGTLGLAIGANAGMFSVVNAVMLKPLPYAHQDRLVYVAATAPGSQLPPEFGVSSEFYVQYGERSKLLESVSIFDTYTSTLRTTDRVERVRMCSSTFELFATLGGKPILGRLPVADDESRVAIISYALWKNWFGGDSAVIGRQYQISGMSRTVIGVMGPEFRFPTDETLLWIPGVVHLQGLTPGRFGSGMVARAKPGATPTAVALELTSLARQLPERFGGSANYAKIMAQHRAIVRPLVDQMVGGAARPLWVLLGGVAIVLLIACANVANLFMVRSEGRQREMAVRRAIGAGRGQLVRLQVSEAAVVAALAAVVAVVLAWVTLPLLLHAAPPGVPRLGNAGLDAATLAFTAATAVVTALACGLVPALRASSPDFARLREGGRGATRRGNWGRDGLVVGQTALALVLLISSGLLVRSYSRMSHVNPGYDTKDIFTFQIAPEQKSLTDGPSYARFNLEFMDRMRALPGVEMVGLVENVPLDEGTATGRFRTEESPGGADTGTRLHYTFAAADYFKTVSIPVLEGRPFVREDNSSQLGNVIISKSAANLLWPGKDAIGRRLQLDGLDAWHTVVGVVSDVMQENFRTPPEALVYFPLVGPAPNSWVSSSPAYVVKTARAEVIAPEIRAIVKQIAPEAPMYRAYTMSFLAQRSMLGLSFTMLTLGIVSMLALILGAVGLYGVLSYVVAERTREIGVRMALGAEASQVRSMVVAQAARVVGIGVVIGIAVALASTRALGGLLFGVKAFDFATFAGMSAMMVGIGLLASYVPARRASSVDPIESLRED